jgi:lipoprotein LpqB-like beta-propeller protein/sporulation and spore germination protein
MADAGPRRPRRWPFRGLRLCLLAALAVAVAGCVGMPNSGSPGTFSATPKSTSQDSDFIGAVPAGPQPGWSPSQIVNGFLNATLSYPAYSTIAQQFLARPDRNWAPYWSVLVVDQVNVSRYAQITDGGRKATVSVSGTVRASFNGTGQYVGAQQGQTGTQTASQDFTLVKQGKQWLITNPPQVRMLAEPDFAKVYKPQDLYFFDSTGQVLVPDAVFVPAGTSPGSLATNLVTALLANPQPDWLRPQGNTAPPAVTAFPLHSSVKNVNVIVDGTTATVNLTGVAASAGPAARQQMAAQLVWTLTGQQGQGVPPNIQAVQLEFNGRPWTPPSPPCPGARSLSPALKQAMYGCKNPFPLAASPVFYYVANGQAWSRCVLEAQVTTGFVGPVAPVFSRAGKATLNPVCKSSVQASSQSVLPSQPHGLPALLSVTASPDGKYLAGVSPDAKTVYVWPAGTGQPASTMRLPGVTAIGWDRRDNLWIAQGDVPTTVVRTSNGGHFPVPNFFPAGRILGLSIAPDGVRIAAIVHTAAGSEVELAAVDSSKPASGDLANPYRGRAASGPFQPAAIGLTVQLGPNIVNPIALTWFDADNLLVLDGAGEHTSLWKVPVDGQPAVRLPGELPGAISITANSAKNALVVGLTGGQMEVSAGLEGPWQRLGNGGQNPAFQAPVIPVTSQPRSVSQQGASTLCSRYVTFCD